MSDDAVATLSREEKRRLLAELLAKKAAPRWPAPAPEHAAHAPFALTDMQQAFWVGRSSAAQLGNIGIHGYLEIECVSLDVPRAARAFDRLVRRHEMLRAIVLPDGTQRVLEQVPPVEIATMELSCIAGAEREAKLLAQRDALSHQVFDLQRWPLFDIRAAKLDAQTTLLFFSIDLIIADTRSVVNLFREWAALYHEPERELPPLGCSFQQCVLQEPVLARSAAYARAEAYWTRRLGELPAAPQLPLRVDPSAITEPRFVRHADVLDAARWAALKERARGHGLTPSVLLCSVYAEVLARWSTSAHFTLNVIPSVRAALHPDVDRVIGAFSALTLLEVDLREPQSLLACARALQLRLYDDLDHMQYNGVKVLRKLAQLRGSGLDALMPVVFTSTMLDLREFEGLGAIRYMLSQTPQVWIDHQLAERDGALLFNWDVVEALFPEGMIAEMFAAFSARIHELADDAEALLRSAPRELAPAQRAAREQANRTHAPLPEGTLHERVWQRAEQEPERTALICSERRMSYAELAHEARYLSRELRRRGARPGQVVAVSFPKGFRQVMAVFAVLDAGAAYLPIDPALPVARRQQLLSRARCQLIVSAPEHVQDLDAAVQLVEIARDTPPSADDGELEAPVSSASSDDLAYVIFTSGSTGVPKGVMISHRAALNTIDDINARFGVTARDRVLALSSLSFDLSVYDVFGPLSVGGCVVLTEPDHERDPAHWLALIEREQITIWNSVPALMRMLVEHGAGAEVARSLRVVLLSGDWIPVTLPAAIECMAPAAHIVSLGGATEAAIWSIQHTIEHVPPQWTSIPYGKPLTNQRWHVRDGSMRDCPCWVAGELYIAGAGLARGYLDDPETTRASFVTDPGSGERLYRTGDVGRYLPDGTIEFLGRRDSQVKIGGHRIELGEIEAQLLRHGAVRAACVRASGERHDRQLVAYVELEPQAAADGGEAREPMLRAHLAEQLPAYMVPRQIVLLDQLPLTANGKLDVASLPLPEPPPSADTAVYEAASEEQARLERCVIEVWEEVLQKRPISPLANFFDLGGDSLRMVRVRRLLQERLGREIPVVELYARPKPALLANYLSQAALPPTAAAPSSGRERAARRLRALGGASEAGR